MLVEALYDFTPREEDSQKTLPFRQKDLLMFIEVYPRDGNWLQAAARNGRIGFIPRNYVQISDMVGRDAVLEFLLDATLAARQDKLETIETLESLKDHVVRIEYREFQARTLRQAMKYQPDELSDAGDAGPNGNYMDDRSSNQAEVNRNQARVQVHNGSINDNNSLYTARSDNYEYDQMSIKTEPVRSTTKIPTAPKRSNPVKQDVKRPGEVEEPVSGRPSKSCPLGPSVGKFNIAEEIRNEIDEQASGDNVVSDSSLKTEFTRRDLTTKLHTRIPVRTTPSTSRYNRSEPEGPTPSEYSSRLVSQASANSDRNRTSIQNWEEMADRLVKIAQESGGHNVNQSEVLVHRLLHHINENFQPAMADKVGSVLRVFESYTSVGSRSHGIDSEAGSKFQDALKFLASVGKRSLHETPPGLQEESLILEQLEKLSDELINLDNQVLKSVMEVDRYHSIHDLILLYQSETRASVRNRLLEIFAIFSTLDFHCRSVLLRSSLPIELARELYGSEGNPRHISRIANVLISLLSGGEPTPAAHYEHLGSKLINFILNYLESFREGESEEKAKTDLMNLLLAYNLQFTPKDENFVIKTLAGRASGRYFIEAMLYLFEQEADPIKGGGETEGLVSVPHSVIKLMKDMFSSRMTAEHFHTVEMKVLIDFLAQSLAENLGPGDSRRTDYLELTWRILRNSGFQYRSSDIREVLVAILLEEDPLSIPDQKIIRGISKEFPNIFKKGTSLSGNTNVKRLPF